MAKRRSKRAPLDISVIHLDTNFLIQSMISGSACEMKLLKFLKNGEQIGVSAIAWSEFLCGPLTERDEMLAALLLSPPVPFLASDAKMAAELFNKTGRRSRTLADCQIAAVAHRLNASIATANESDFKPFVPFGVKLA
jgi:predicted nucleic acid-binding protein